MKTATDWTPEAAEAMALAPYAYRETVRQLAELRAEPPRIVKWEVKCDDCKKTIRETTDVRESYAGGTCDACKVKHEAANARFLAAVDPYQMGAIVSHSWGYEQTNIDFFRIVKRVGDWVTIQKMTAVEKSNGPTSMTGTVVPGEDTDAKPFRRKLRYGSATYGTANKIIGFPIKSYGWASAWDGQPEHVSHYG